MRPQYTEGLDGLVDRVQEVTPVFLYENDEVLHHVDEVEGDVGDEVAKSNKDPSSPVPPYPQTRHPPAPTGPWGSSGGGPPPILHPNTTEKFRI